MKHKIGVFDSGVGGLSIVKAIESRVPDITVLYADDSKNVPYGTKSATELHALVLPILNNLVDQGCEVLVIACNTVTTTIIDTLRSEFAVPLIGMEPMVKPAAASTKSGIIAVCATPATLQSARYAALKQEFTNGIEVLEPDCSDWAHMIEANQLDHQQIAERIKAVCEQGADTIVLGCTHYHWIEEDIQNIANAYNATVIQPEQPVIDELTRVLARLG